MLKRLPAVRPAAHAALLTGCTTSLGTRGAEPRGDRRADALDRHVRAALQVRVLVKNPNDLELPIKGLDYQIILMGDSFAEGVASNSFILPALGEAEFDMLVSTNFVSGFARLLAAWAAASSRTSITRSSVRSTSRRHDPQDSVQPPRYRRFSKTLPPIKPAGKSL